MGGTFSADSVAAAAENRSIDLSFIFAERNLMQKLNKRVVIIFNWQGNINCVRNTPVVNPIKLFFRYEDICAAQQIFLCLKIAKMTNLL